jgi:hypothetical protein
MPLNVVILGSPKNESKIGRTVEDLYLVHSALNRYVMGWGKMCLAVSCEIVLVRNFF